MEKVARTVVVLKNAEFSESSLNALLSDSELLANYHRYKRATRPHPHAMMNEDELRQYDEDRAFYNKVYEENRMTSFLYASELACEKLFLRCFGR